MSNEELKQALLDGSLVKWCSGSQGVECEYTVSGIIYRCKDGKVIVTVELADKNKKSVLITTPERIEKIDTEN